jgi:hypothetical protein
MGLGVASLCSLRVSGLNERAEILHDTTVNTFEIDGKAVRSCQAICESGQGINARLLWYTALHEAREYTQND